MRPFRALACICLVAAAAAADRSPVLENWSAIQRVHAEELAAFATALDAKEGSLDAEARVQALALAKKLDPTLRVKEAAKKPMAPEDQLADKATREASATRDQEREAAEKAAPAPEPGTRQYPEPGNAKERFEALRFEIVCDEAEYVATLSANPEIRGEAELRQGALKSLIALLGQPKWACEKALKDRLTELAAAKYAPWSGVWTTRLGDLTLTQTGDKVAGFWGSSAEPDGTLQGVVKDRAVTGSWKTPTEQGSFTFTLFHDDCYWKGGTKTKTDYNPLEGRRAAPGLARK